MKPLSPPAMPEAESWGDLGPAMKALNSRMQDFVRHLVTEKPGYGALTRAYRKAGYGKNSRAATLSKEAHHMSRDERIIAAIAEESRKVVRVGHPEIVAAAFNLIRSPEHRDHGRAVFGLLDRLDPQTTRHSIDVTHRTIDPDHAPSIPTKTFRAGPSGSSELTLAMGIHLRPRFAPGCQRSTSFLSWTASKWSGARLYTM